MMALAVSGGYLRQSVHPKVLYFLSNGAIKISKKYLTLPYKLLYITFRMF